MKKSELKKTLKHFDDIPMPAKEKMLPPEALVERNGNARRVRKPLPKLAAVGFAAVALVLAGALVAGSVAVGSGNKQAPDGDMVLKNDSDISTPSYDDITPDESKVALEDMPIISGGKYSDSGDMGSTGTFVGTSYYLPYETGKVYYASIRSESPTDIDLYFPSDDVLYAVYLNCCWSSKDIYGSQEYKDGEAQIEAEHEQDKILLAEKLFDCILNEYGDEGIDAIISDLNSYDEFSSISAESLRITSASKYYVDDIPYHCQQYKFSYLAADLDDYRKCGKSAFSEDDYTVFCNGFLSYCLGTDCTDGGGIDVRHCYAVRVYRKLSEAEGKDYLEWKDPLNDEFIELNWKKVDKKKALYRSLYNSANGLDYWYESLENSGAKIYEKTVYYVFNNCDDYDSSLDRYLGGSRVYKIAFLTKEQIKSIQLNGDEDYSLRIVLACDELATMENNTVYFEAKFNLCIS